MEQRFGGERLTFEEEVRLQQQEHSVRSSQEAPAREQVDIFSTKLENSVIANMSEIGVYAFAIYSVIKMHANQDTGDSSPSYAEIARITGMNRSTVISLTMSH
jgi:helix-turn-helix protein